MHAPIAPSSPSSPSSSCKGRSTVRLLHVSCVVRSSSRRWYMAHVVINALESPQLFCFCWKDFPESRLRSTGKTYLPKGTPP
eukprot:4873235-Prymnesium_polylepis.1